MISKPEQLSSSTKLLESLITVSQKISDSLRFQLSAEQIDDLAQEHKAVMEQIKTIPKTEMKHHQPILKNIQKQVQSLQEEMGNYHQAVKEKLISFGQKRKQINAYNAMS